jgi:nitroreductase
VEALGLGTVWKHILPDWIEQVREILHIPVEYHFINLLPIGYAQQLQPPHSDTEFDWRKIHSNQY